ncbi:hypothetical protein [Lactococcus termiticola]|uniref:Cystathionine beta-lyase n=1 Tax=Lactococcus termiticola TaxID=2169526 RepID=A0A2R5HJU7_9LACT|nr:hypothetical protein [Lactococcus termiticola]GBG96958.1 hypothetical protein NtB2_01094 [Lactococcus termiticola]
MANWLDLAMKYGGFMAQDKVFLENRLAQLDDEADKRLLATPPASVLNAYFAELYQKKSPKDATDYYFEMSKALDMFQENPDFQLEGKPGAEQYRFIRLNISGQSFGYSYLNDQEEALVFSEFPRAIDTELIFEVSQIFPQYFLQEADDKILMKPLTLEGDFEYIRDASELTTVSECDNFIRVSSYNIEELRATVEEIGYIRPPFLQYAGKMFHYYIPKGF